MNFKKIILQVLFLTNVVVLFGQPIALKKFLDTDFIHEFDSIRTRANKSVTDFKAIQHLYSEEDVNRVADAYDASAGLFNNALYNIKDDILTKDKRKYILKYPEDYSKQMMADLYRAKEFYENDYGNVLYEVTEGKVDNAFPFMAIVSVFRIAQRSIQIFNQLKDQWSNFNEDLLNTHLIEKHRFKLWEEIE